MAVNTLMTALGLVLIAEGLPYFISPARMKLYALYLATIDDRALRIGGFILALMGLGIVYAFAG